MPDALIRGTLSFLLFFLSGLLFRPIERAAAESCIFDGATDRIMRTVCACVSTSNKKNGIKIEWNDLINRMSGRDLLKGALDAIKSQTSNRGRSKWGS
jgi:hypothetical protein